MPQNTPFNIFSFYFFFPKLSRSLSNYFSLLLILFVLFGLLKTSEQTEIYFEKKVVSVLMPICICTKHNKHHELITLFRVNYQHIVYMLRHKK